MRKPFRSSAVATLFASLAYFLGCSAGSLDDPYAEESVAKTSQALRRPGFERVSQSGSGQATAECSADMPYALGTGALWSGPFNGVYYQGYSTTSNKVIAQRPNLSGNVSAVAICSDASASLHVAYNPNGNKTVVCPSGMVAVGGGGYCDDASAKLFRSRPSPPDNWSKPTGWRASCTSGGVTTVANCVDEDDVYDFTHCYTMKKSESDGGAVVTCPDGTQTVAAGAYCGGGSAISYMNPGQYLTTSASGCTQTATVHAYAVCCGEPLT